MLKQVKNFTVKPTHYESHTETRRKNRKKVVKWKDKHRSEMKKKHYNSNLRKSSVFKQGRNF